LRSGGRGGRNGDADGDGIPGWWEEQYFGSVTNGAPEADPDGDGMPTLFEYLADTNPTNALSVLRISRIVTESNGLRIEWQGGEQSRQFVERNNDMALSTDRWVVIHSNNPPTPLLTNFFDILGTNRTLFYRVRAVRE
jgi:hypothetical protein